MNPQMNAIFKQVHQAIMVMLHTADIGMAVTVNESDKANFLTNAAWVIHSTYHKVLKTLPHAANFGRDTLF